MVAVVPVVLSGGSGTRLWPLSREKAPKQFLPLVGERSLFQDAVERANGIGAVLRPPVVICNSAHAELVAAQLEALGITDATIVLEPVGRNTAPAVAVAALLASVRSAGDDEAPLLLVMPADHVVLDRGAFVRAVQAAVAAAQSDHLVTFGIVPDRPETGYGYIERGEPHSGYYAVKRFVEKPGLADATRFVETGNYLWNSGMFLFSAPAFLQQLRLHEPGILSACERSIVSATTHGRIVSLGADFVGCASNSIDYAIMERTTRAAVVPLSAGWSDVGSWPALHDVLPADSAGNAIAGDVILKDARNVYVSAQSRLVVAIGVSDVVVVETPDAVLVVARDRAQDVKDIVTALRASGRPEV